MTLSVSSYVEKLNATWDTNPAVVALLLLYLFSVDDFVTSSSGCTIRHSTLAEGRRHATLNIREAETIPHRIGRELSVQSSLADAML